MNSKKFSSNLSLPMILENLKRFWAGSLLAFLGYFLIGTLPIIFSKGYGNLDEYMIRSMMQGTWPPYILILFLVPPVAAFLIYKYMQQQSSTAIMNALPFSRRMLFHSNFLSGAILCIAPIILNAIILLFLSEPVMMLDHMQEGEVYINVFSGAAIFRWAMLYTILSLLLYAIAMFAATITGSSLIQFLMSFGFIFLMPAVLLCIVGFSDQYLYGYTQPEILENLLVWTSPAMGVARGDISYKLMVWYFVCFLIVYLVTYLLYHRRKMEKATDTIAFNFIKPIFKYLITFFGMTAMGFMFMAFGSENLMYLGALVGALLGYVISDMIVQKSLRIKGFIKGFGIYLVLGVLFFGSFFADITGYETRVPELDDIDHVYMTSNDVMGRMGYTRDQFVDDPEILQEVRAFHEDITKTAEQEEAFLRSPERIDFQRFLYELNNGSSLERYYHLPYSFYSENEHLKNIFESESYKEQIYPILDPSSNVSTRRSTFILYPNGQNSAFGNQSISLTKEEAEEFADLYKKDLREETFEEVIQYISPVCRVEIGIPEVMIHYDEFGEPYSEEYYNSEDYDIMPYDEHVIGWLKEKGYYDTVALNPEDIATAEVYVHSESGMYQAGQPAGEAVEIQETQEIVYVEEPIDMVRSTKQITSNFYTEDPCIGTLTDPAQIQEVLDTGQRDYINYHEYYYVVFHTADEEDDYYSTRYFELDRVPDFIKNM